jgi:hypothetical protein
MSRHEPRFAGGNLPANPDFLLRSDTKSQAIPEVEVRRANPVLARRRRAAVHPSNAAYVRIGGWLAASHASELGALTEKRSAPAERKAAGAVQLLDPARRRGCERRTGCPARRPGRPLCGAALRRGEMLKEPPRLTRRTRKPFRGRSGQPSTWAAHPSGRPRRPPHVGRPRRQTG